MVSVSCTSQDVGDEARMHQTRHQTPSEARVHIAHRLELIVHLSTWQPQGSSGTHSIILDWSGNAEMTSHMLRKESREIRGPATCHSAV